MSSRFFNRTLQLVADVAVLSLAYVLAYLVRFEGSIPALMWRTLAWTLPYVVAMQYGFLRLFGVHRLVWRYVGIPDLRRIAATVGAGAAVLVAARVAAGPAARAYAPLFRAVIPLSVALIDPTFAFLGLTGLRVVRRMLAEQVESGSRPNPENEPVRTMLIGAGRAGVLVAKEITARPDLGILPVGFLDDDVVKVGTLVHGVSVLGTTGDLARLCEQRNAKQALITMAAVKGGEIRRIAELCRRARVPVKIIPGLFELVGGHINLSRIRKIAIEDLLRRDPVVLDEEAIHGLVKGRVVLVTGAGGSIGSELCRQICRFGPRSLILVEHAENNLFFIDRELRLDFPELSVHPCIADIRDGSRMEAVFVAHAPQVVFHAAAHKHVPMMEANPGEALKNNVLGTHLIAEMSGRHAVEAFVMISTDKAVNPTSVMGASKRAAEIVVQALSQRSKTRFVAVRFGNVLGSAGSVVPLFQEQIAKGGPLTVTHPDMKRYFMTIPEACQLVLQAGAMGRGGEIFVLDMGEPVRVVDLARDLLALSGLSEGADIEIQFTGMRPGEKLFEELSLADEQAERTMHPKVFVGRIKPHPWEQVTAFLRQAQQLSESDVADPERIRDVLGSVVAEYRPGEMKRGEGPQVMRSAEAPQPSSSRALLAPEG